MDVAKLAGVSSATVSRVLNKSNLVKPEIRQRVEDAMQQLQYMPNAAARSLASRKTRTLGAIIPTLNNAIFAEGINAFETAARELDYTLLLSVSHYDLEDEQQITRKMIEQGVDGLLLVGNEHAAATYEMLRNARLRHACVWTYLPESPVPNIGFSNTAAISLVVDHLVRIGHKKMAMLAGETAGNDRARERLEGARLRMMDHNLSLPDEMVVESPYSIRTAREKFQLLMAKKPTAVICGNDVIAFGAVLEARAMGLAIPGDIAITGFDNLPLSGELSPAITTVDVLAVEMGEYSARALITAIHNNTEVVSRQFDTRLIIRETTVSQQ